MYNKVAVIMSRSLKSIVMNKHLRKSYIYIYVSILIPTIKREVINVTKTDVDLHQTK